jgi:hypothetical protein
MKLDNKVILNGSFVANVDSSIMDIRQMYGFAIQFEYGGTAPVATLVVQGTNDNIEDPTVTPTWSDEITTVSVTGTGNIMLNFNNRFYQYSRVHLAYTSGTVTCRAKFIAKGP